MKTKFILPLLCLGAALGLSSCSNEDNFNIDGDFKLVPDDVPTPLIQPDGFYFINEDWFGHAYGSINHIDANYGTTYNLELSHIFPDLPEETKTPDGKVEVHRLGVTSTVAGAYNNYYFILSKQGNRLIVTDKDFKLVKKITDIGGDGRSFVGVNEDKVYLSTLNGITILDISDKNNIHTTTQIAGLSGQTGNMVYINNKVFAVVQGKGLFVIDTTTDTVLEQLAGNYTQVVLDRHGQVWAAMGNTIQKINPYDIEDKQDFDISGAPINATWFAWNPGSLSSSMQTDHLYWTKAKTVIKFDTQNGTFEQIHDLGSDKNGKPLSFYASGLKVDPVTDHLILDLFLGFGTDASYNYVRILDNTGVSLRPDIFLKDGDKKANINPENGYYWFPSMAFFQDNNAPEILTNQLILKPETEYEIDLEKIISDPDTPVALATVTIKSFPSDIGTIYAEQGKLFITTALIQGRTSFTIKVNSNGKIAEKEIELWIK
ncbi:DUF5074 domain-containing protein [Myroides sp. LJL116]